MINDLNAWVQYGIWVLTVAIVIFGTLRYQLIALRQMPTDEQLDNFADDPGRFSSECYQMAFYNLALSAIFLLCLQPGATVNLLLSLYLGISFPAVTQKGTFWLQGFVKTLKANNFAEN